MQRTDNKILEVKGLSKQFGGTRAIDRIDLSFEELKLCSIIGPNGAGKTTFFRMIMGSLYPSEGEIIYKNRNITKLSMDHRSRLGICQTFQITSIFLDLSVLENIRVSVQSTTNRNFRFFRSASSYHDIIERSIDILERIRLVDKKSAIAKNLSYGEKRSLEIGITLARNPTLILMDEPTAGMAHDEILSTINLINEIAKSKTVVMVEHNLDVVFSLSSRIIVLNWGQIISDGLPEDVKNDENVKKVYLSEEL